MTAPWIASSVVLAVGASVSVSANADVDSVRCHSVDLDHKVVNEQARAADSAANILRIPYDCSVLWAAGLPVPGQQAVLRFRQLPAVFLDQATSCLTVPSWGVSVPVQKGLRGLRDEMLHDFLALKHEVETRGLTATDENTRTVWRAILRDVDYSDFCEQTAPLTWTKGVRVSCADCRVTVRWDDGEEERLSVPLSEQLSLIHDGEGFVALSRFVNGKASAFSHVSPLSETVEAPTWIV